MGAVEGNDSLDTATEGPVGHASPGDVVVTDLMAGGYNEGLEVAGDLVIGPADLLLHDAPPALLQRSLVQ